MKTLPLLAAVLLAPLCAHAAEPASSLAPLIYTIDLRSETVSSGSLGLVTSLVGQAYVKAHEQFLDALKQTTGGGSPDILRPLACLSGTCRPLIEQPAKSPPDWLASRLAEQPTHRAKVANIKVIFDGRFFQVPVKFGDARLDASGKVVLENVLQMTYIRTYSRSQHAQDIRAHRIDTPFDGKPGSRDAHMHFWLGGSDPRLPRELALSFELIGALLEARLSPEHSGEISAALANKKSLPRVRDLTSQDPTCKVLHGAFPVVRDLGDYLWLGVPGDASKVGNSLFIEPRCGFDY